MSQSSTMIQRSADVISQFLNTDGNRNVKLCSFVVYYSVTEYDEIVINAVMGN